MAATGELRPDEGVPRPSPGDLVQVTRTRGCSPCCSTPLALTCLAETAGDSQLDTRRQRMSDQQEPGKGALAAGCLVGLAFPLPARPRVTRDAGAPTGRVDIFGAGLVDHLDAPAAAREGVGVASPVRLALPECSPGW